MLQIKLDRNVHSDVSGMAKVMIKIKGTKEDPRVRYLIEEGSLFSIPALNCGFIVSEHKTNYIQKESLEKSFSLPCDSFQSRHCLQKPTSDSFEF